MNPMRTNTGQPIHVLNVFRGIPCNEIPYLITPYRFALQNGIISNCWNPPFPSRAKGEGHTFPLCRQNPWEPNFPAPVWHEYLYLEDDWRSEIGYVVRLKPSKEILAFYSNISFVIYLWTIFQIDFYYVNTILNFMNKWRSKWFFVSIVKSFQLFLLCAQRLSGLLISNGLLFRNYRIPMFFVSSMKIIRCLLQFSRYL